MQKECVLGSVFLRIVDDKLLSHYINSHQHIVKLFVVDDEEHDGLRGEDLPRHEVLFVEVGWEIQEIVSVGVDEVGELCKEESIEDMELGLSHGV